MTDLALPDVAFRPAPTAADRLFVETVYRAMRMFAAAIRKRYGVIILVEIIRS